MSNNIKTYTVEYEDAGQRIDVFLSGIYSEFSRSSIQKSIKNGNILINNAVSKPSQIIRTDDVIQVCIKNIEQQELLAQNIPLDIKYEDDSMLVVNKPSGMLTHPTSKERTDTLVNALLYYTNGNLSTCNGEDRPGIVHRLDRNTSGLLMIAKNNEAYEALKQQMQEHTVKKHYYALVCGSVANAEDTIDANIGRHPTKPEKMAVTIDGKPSITNYKVIERFNKYTLLDVNLITGRTHQIRVHMSHIGHPIVNDTMYGGATIPVKTNEQVLQSYSLEFISPFDNQQKHIEIGFDNDIIKALNYLRSKK